MAVSVNLGVLFVDVVMIQSPTIWSLLYGP